MFIIEVIPLANLPPQVPQLLSYFFNKTLVKGSVVEVLIGNRTTPAIVISSTSLEKEKASLKKSSFQLKKLSKVISETPLVSDVQFKMALWLSQNYFAPLGLCLKTVLPPFFLKKSYPDFVSSEAGITKSRLLDFSDKSDGFVKNRDELRITNYELKSTLQSATYNPLVLLTSAKDILKNIDREIKKILEQKKQVLIIVPEISTAKYFYDILAGYYETTLVHSKISLKKTYQNWRDITSGNTEIIIGTRQALFSPFSDLGLLILEDPANEAYKSDMSPKYNTFDLALKIAGIFSCPQIMVSQIPSIREYDLLGRGSYDLRGGSNYKDMDIKIVDMVQEMKSGNFSVLSRDLKNQVVEAVKNKERTLIFSSRKGYFGALVCENCGLTFNCPNCSIPLKPHKTSSSILVCHRCSAVQKPPDFCPNCHSYKLKTSGFPGSQRLEEEIKAVLDAHGLKPEVFIFDASSIKKSETEEDMIKRMEELDSCICIGTQMLFSHRYNTKFDLVAIPNIDSLTTIPDFKSEEQLFYQFGKLKDFEPEKIIIQTYNRNPILLNSLKTGDYKQFYDRELSLRKIFWYPPFAKLVKLSFKHTNPQKASYEARLTNEKLRMAIIQKRLEESVKVLDPSPAFIEKERGFYIHNIILKILPDQKLDDILRYVPSGWIIDVDPKNIL